MEGDVLRLEVLRTNGVFLLVGLWEVLMVGLGVFSLPSYEVMDEGIGGCCSQ